MSNTQAVGQIIRTLLNMWNSHTHTKIPIVVEIFKNAFCSLLIEWVIFTANVADINRFLPKVSREKKYSLDSSKLS